MYLLRTYGFVLLLLLIASAAMAQDMPATPRRTAEERAMKQTGMLVRDLGIRDSLTRDTIYRVHLRYTRSREKVTTRSEAIECMNRLLAELKGILTKSQYERLQAIPLRHGARAPHAGRDTVSQTATPPAP